MQQPTVLLLFGGESSEHDVSISSAKNVLAAINFDKYNVVLGYITQTGEWYRIESIDELTAAQDRQLQVNFSTRQFISNDGDIVVPDVILPILHGKNGEDGSVQGLAQLLHIPIVGCDMTASVLAMDKIASKALFTEAGLDVLPYKVYRVHEPLPEYSEIVAELGEVQFVKPSRAGSSVGVSRVASEDEYYSAMKLALNHDSLVLIEQAADVPRELEVAILASSTSRDVSVVGEIKPDRSFYSYESKYDESSQTDIVIPAILDSHIVERVRSEALIAYDSLHCSNMARVDFLLAADGRLYINEINTIPGFTNMSMYPKLWLHSGISYELLINRLISAALK